MRLERITATAHPSGNRIDLTWVHPDPAGHPGVRVVRREGTHPISPTPDSPREGVVVADTHPTSSNQRRVQLREDGKYTAADTDLKGETVYYYTLFPYSGDLPVYRFDHYNRAAAIATAPYGIAGQMFDLLPALYHRYDAALSRPDGVSTQGRHEGQLRCFLDLPGSQLDLLYSFARAALYLHNLEKVDGRLLPLLAQWIGWQTNFRLEIAARRNEIRDAPHLYRTIGLIPTVEATVKRFLGLETRTKEFVHNVFLSNSPERLNLWALERSDAGEWLRPTEPLSARFSYSLDFAYEGRPAAARDSDGTLWLFYHTLKKGQWDIWYKTRGDQGWTASRSLTDRQVIDQHPTVARQGANLWVFWDSCSKTEQRWSIHYRTRTAGQWSVIETFADSERERRRPWAAVDQDDGLWLFWLEKTEGEWRLKYNRHDGDSWLETSRTFPLDTAGEESRLERDPFVLFHRADETLWVFWSRKEPAATPGQTQWRLMYRIKGGTEPGEDDWGAVTSFPRAAADGDDVEPAAALTAGNVELFWSSNRNGSWSIWHATFDAAADDWGAAEPVTSNPYSQRDPLPIATPANESTGTWLVYHSNESLTYASAVYGATETVDARYAGSTTLDTRHQNKLALRGRFEDFQTYTYDTGRDGRPTELTWYARNVTGIYFTADGGQALDIGNQQRIKAALREFLPASIRPVFIHEPTDEGE